jgi:hypothetical protein
MLFKNHTAMPFSELTNNLLGFSSSHKDILYFVQIDTHFTEIKLIVLQFGRA